MDPEQTVSTEAPAGESPAVETPTLDIEATVADIAKSLDLGGEEDGDAEEGQGEGEKAAEGKDALHEVEPAKVEATPAPAAVEDAPPDTWTKEARAKWAETPAEVRQELKKREQDISKYVGETKTPIAVAQAMEKILEPYAPMFNKYGVNPWEHIPKLLNAHANLTFGSPEQKVAMFRQMAVDSGIDVAKLAQEGNAAGDNPTLSHVRQLQQRIAELERGVTGVTSTVQAARAAELESGILAFAQDEKEHPFFWEVTDKIQHFIQTGAAKTLDSAYKLAVMDDPITRTKVIEMEAAKAAAAKATSAAEKVVKAKKVASSNVRTSGKGRVASMPGSIDDTLKEALANIHSRETH